MGKISKALEKSGQPQENQTGHTDAAISSINRGRDRGAFTPPGTSLKKYSGLDGMFENEKWDLRLKMSSDPHLPYFESFRRLRTSVLHPSSGKKTRTVLVTSVAPHEGKGFVSANLGIAIAQDIEHHALILDCDFRSPSLAHLFGQPNEAGLVDHLKDSVDLSFLIRKTGQPKLSLIPAGKPPANPSEMLTSSRMSALIEEVAERYDDRVVLFDTPPNIVASETGILAKQTDGVVLVVRHGVSKREHVKKFIDFIGPEKIIGLVYNAYPEDTIDKLIDKKMGYSYDYGRYY